MRFSPRKCDTCKKLRFFWRGAAKFCSAECTIKALKECGWRPPIGKERVCVEIGFMGRDFFARFINEQLWRVRMLGFAEDKRQRYVDGLYDFLHTVMTLTGIVPSQLRGNSNAKQGLRSQRDENVGKSKGGVYVPAGSQQLADIRSEQRRDESDISPESLPANRQATVGSIQSDRVPQIVTEGEVIRGTGNDRIDELLNQPAVFPGSLESVEDLKAFEQQFKEQTHDADDAA